MRGPALSLEDGTIAAISTPFGVGGIGIVRVSGPEAEATARKIFRPRKQPAERFVSHRFYYGHVCDPKDGTVVDEVLFVVMRAPKTYTREEMVEIHCHGGTVPARRILELLQAGGARLAEPGEFTRRAFLNGRIDLVQAEAVAEIVEAKTDAALRFAERQLDGVLSREIGSVKQAVKSVLVEVEAWLDFPEEDLPDPAYPLWRERIEQARSIAGSLVDTYRQAHLFRDGANLVIGGRTNVGKSTLLNALVGKDRAIVSETPGTTRDYLEEPLDIEGIPVRLIDTAGLREVAEEVESIGVELARRQIRNADLVLYVTDVTGQEPEAWDSVLELVPAGRTLIVINKTDRVGDSFLEGKLRSLPPGMPGVPVSALYGKGIEALKQAIARELAGGRIDLDARAVITNVRHRNALQRCMAALERAEGQLGRPEVAGDLLAADLRHALRAVGEILGETAPEEVLADIFEAFCIGK